MQEVLLLGLRQLGEIQPGCGEIQSGNRKIQPGCEEIQLGYREILPGRKKQPRNAISVCISKEMINEVIYLLLLFQSVTQLCIYLLTLWHYMIEHGSIYLHLSLTTACLLGFSHQFITICSHRPRYRVMC